MGLGRAHDHPGGPVEEPLWIFDQEPRKDKILHVALQDCTARLREMGIPERREDLAKLMAEMVPTKVRDVAVP